MRVVGMQARGAHVPCASSHVPGHATHRSVPRRGDLTVARSTPEDPAPSSRPGSSQTPASQPSPKATLRMDPMDPVQTVQWGGTLPSTRRAVVGGLAAAGIALGGNLGGISSFLLSLDDGQLAAKLKVDTVIPVLGYKRCVDYRNSFEFTYPAEWLADQTLVIRAAQRAEAERFRDYDIDSPQLRQQRRQQRERQSVSEPVVAFGPPNTAGEENVSVIVAPIFEGFSLGSLGTPEQSAQTFLSLIAPEGSGKVADLIAAGQRVGPGGQQYYFMEYTIKGKTFYRHNVSVYASRNNLLYTFNAQCPVETWDQDAVMLRKSAGSFMLLTQ